MCQFSRVVVDRFNLSPRRDDEGAASKGVSDAAVKQRARSQRTRTTRNHRRRRTHCIGWEEVMISEQSESQRARRARLDIAQDSTHVAPNVFPVANSHMPARSWTRPPLLGWKRISGSSAPSKCQNGASSLEEGESDGDVRRGDTTGANCVCHPTSCSSETEEGGRRSGKVSFGDSSTRPKCIALTINETEDKSGEGESAQTERGGVGETTAVER